MSATTDDIDAQLIMRLDKLKITENFKLFAKEMKDQVRTECWRESGETTPMGVLKEIGHRWSELTLTQRVNWRASGAAPSLNSDKVTASKKKKQWSGGKKRKSGYQRFVSENFSVARDNLSKRQSVSQNHIPSHEVFSELSVCWQEKDQACKLAWNNFATRKGPKPSDKTLGLDALAPACVENYMAKHNLQNTLDNAVNAAIDMEAENPTAFIAQYLNTLEWATDRSAPCCMAGSEPMESQIGWP